MAYLGIDIGGTNIAIGRTKQTQVSDISTIPTPKEADQKTFLQTLFKQVDSYTQKKTIQGIGIGWPGIAQPKEGILVSATELPNIQSLKIKQEFENRYSIPTFVQQDGNAFALGQTLHGAGQGKNTVVGITLGTSFGGGIVMNGHIHGGRNNLAGEFGRIPYLDSRVSMYCSNRFFVSQHQTTAKEVFERAEDGEEEAKKIWKIYGDHVGKALFIITLAVSPDIIIIGGTITKARNYFEESMRETLNEISPQPRIVEDIVIAFPENEHSNIIGAASIAETEQSRT